jgi:hypothetical protein
VLNRYVNSKGSPQSGIPNTVVTSLLLGARDAIHTRASPAVTEIKLCRTSTKVVMNDKCVKSTAVAFPGAGAIRIPDGSGRDEDPDVRDPAPGELRR